MDNLKKIYNKDIVNLVLLLYDIHKINNNLLYRLVGYSFLRNYLFKKHLKNILARHLLPNVDDLAFFCLDEGTVQIKMILFKSEYFLTIGNDYCIYTRRNKDVVGYHLTDHFLKNHINSFSRIILNDLINIT